MITPTPRQSFRPNLPWSMASQAAKRASSKPAKVEKVMILMVWQISRLMHCLGVTFSPILRSHWPEACSSKSEPFPAALQQLIGRQISPQMRRPRGSQQGDYRNQSRHNPLSREHQHLKLMLRTSPLADSLLVGLLLVDCLIRLAIHILQVVSSVMWLPAPYTIKKGGVLVRTMGPRMQTRDLARILQCSKTLSAPLDPPLL